MAWRTVSLCIWLAVFSCPGWSGSDKLVEAVVVDAAGTPRTHFCPWDKGVFFRIKLKDESQTASVTMAIKGQPPYASPLRMARGAHNGYLIKGYDLAQRPGHYQATVKVDNEVVAVLPVDICSQPPRPDAVPLQEVRIENGRGEATRVISRRDGGIFVYVQLANADLSQPHHHRIEVECLGPDGRRMGRVLGGMFPVAYHGLKQRSYPAAADPNGHNGFVVDGDWPLGKYLITIRLDGQPLKQIPIQLVP